MAIFTNSDNIGVDGDRLLSKYCLCKEFGWTPNEYDNIKYKDREQFKKIYRIMKSKEQSNMKKSQQNMRIV